MAYQFSKRYRYYHVKIEDFVMRLSFYFTTDDLTELLGRICAAESLAFVRCSGGSVAEYPKAIELASNIQDYRPRFDSTIKCERFFIAFAGSQIRTRKIGVGTQRQQFVLDQLINPESAILFLGGVWNDKVLLESTIDTAYSNTASRAILSVFRRTLSSQSTTVDGSYVGRQAFMMLKRGMRLTSSATSPVECDLK